MSYYNNQCKVWYNYNKGKKECLVFLHGLSGSSSAWKPISDFFIKNNYSALLMDLRGHGLSDKTKDRSKMSIDKIVEDLSAILDKEKIKKVVLIGHCYGGMVVQAFYKKYPKRVKKMILISTSYGYKTRNVRYFGSIATYLFYSFLSLAFYFMHFEKNKSQIDYSIFRDTADLDVKRLYTDIKLTSFWTFLPLFKEAIGFNFFSDLRNIKIPVLIIHGKKDFFFPDSIGREMSSQITKSRLEIIPANHITILSMPEITREKILQFIRH